MGRDGADDKLGGKLQKEKDPLVCSRRQGSEASRTPRIAEQRGHDARAALGSGQREEERTGVWRCLLQTLLASGKHARTLRPGGSRPAPASPESSRHAGPGTRKQPRRRSSCGRAPDRSCARSAPAAAARLSRRSPRAARAAAAASSGGSRPPLKPEPFPGRRRPLCQSAPRAGAVLSPALFPTPSRRQETPAREARGPAALPLGVRR